MSMLMSAKDAVGIVERQRAKFSEFCANHRAAIETELDAVVATGSAHGYTCVNMDWFIADWGRRFMEFLSAPVEGLGEGFPHTGTDGDFKKLGSGHCLERYLMTDNELKNALFNVDALKTLGYKLMVRKPEDRETFWRTGLGYSKYLVWGEHPDMVEF